MKNLDPEEQAALLIGGAFMPLVASAIDELQAQLDRKASEVKLSYAQAVLVFGAATVGIQVLSDEQEKLKEAGE